MDNEVMKKLTVFFMNANITKALEKKFSTRLPLPPVINIIIPQYQHHWHSL